MSSPDDSQAQQTFVFADLAGFTALTEATGDEQAADVARDFCEAARRLLAQHGAQEVKTIGDAVMLRAAEAGGGVRLGLELVEEVGGRHRFPVVRVGMHTGPAIERDGTGSAPPSISPPVYRRSPEARGGHARRGRPPRRRGAARAGRHELRNVGEPVLVYAAVRAGASRTEGLPIDPVCRMAVDAERCAGTLRHDGAEYHFCSLTYAQASASAPERYVRA